MEIGKKNNNNFDKLLFCDIKLIYYSNKWFIQLDKSITIFKMDSINYSKLIKLAAHTFYKNYNNESEHRMKKPNYSSKIKIR